MVYNVRKVGRNGSTPGVRQLPYLTPLYPARADD